jgi:hypothetical protein
MKSPHPPGSPMTLGNMRAQGVRNLIGYCLNDACRHSALIDVSGYPDDVEIPSRRAKCSKCGGKRVDVRPNGKRNPACPTVGKGAQLGKSDHKEGPAAWAGDRGPRRRSTPGGAPGLAWHSSRLFLLHFGG